MADDYCRRCGEALIESVVATEQRACCLNATPIAGICPTHGPLGPHHVVGAPEAADTSAGGDSQAGDGTTATTDTSTDRNP